VDRAVEKLRLRRERSFTSLGSTGTPERRQQAPALCGGLPFLLVQVCRLDGHRRVHVELFRLVWIEVGKSTWRGSAHRAGWLLASVSPVNGQQDVPVDGQ